MRIPVRVVVALSAVAFAACERGAEADAIELGRRAYLANCTACHNPDPTRDGSVGPAVAGSSPELVRLRVLRADYPPGYTPKRDTHLMPAQPFLASEIEHLAAYLGSLPAAR